MCHGPWAGYLGLASSMIKLNIKIKSVGRNFLRVLTHTEIQYLNQGLKWLQSASEIHFIFIQMCSVDISYLHTSYVYLYSYKLHNTTIVFLV